MQVCDTICIFDIFFTQCVLGIVAFTIATSGRENRSLASSVIINLGYRKAHVNGNDISHGKECCESGPNLGSESGVFNFLTLGACQ